jgi:hypothetical protein
MSKLKPNPRDDFQVDWFKLATYPEEVIACPLCGLPETTGVYREECHCWDDRIDGHPKRELRGVTHA